MPLTSSGVKWKRSLPQPELWGDEQALLRAAVNDCTCLWHAGCIANRAELSAQMDLPSSATDAQLLHALYARFGVSAAQRIAGQFAWVLWDVPRHMLVAAR